MSRRLPRRRVLAGSALFGTVSVAGRLSRVTAATDNRSADPPPRNGTASSPSIDNPVQSDADTAPDPDFDNVESVVDETMAGVLEDHDVVGASVTVVHDDVVELTAGYGEADRDEGTPVDADETAFRIGSVSKVFVWTALMQLIEDGAVDPDEDIRTYLESVSIPEAFGESITVEHLATHTAGFEERYQGTWVDDSEEIRSLPKVLNEDRPNRVRPPGRIASYSNYGTALAAQLVADVAGTTFREYVADRVFEPLGMESATFGQPLPDGIEASSGYTTAGSSVREAPELFLELAPAGAATAPASDMARFLRAHLGDGAVDGGRILESESVDGMHEQWFTHHDAISGIAFGLLEDERRGVRVLEHNGQIPGSFYSYLLLIPAHDFGLFVAYNTDAGAIANADFIDAFFEEYFPQPASETPQPDGRPERAAALEGTYQGVRIAESTHARLSSTLQAGEIDVSVDDDGFLVTGFGGPTVRWVEREPLVFDEVGGDGALAFGETDGEITHLFRGFAAYERISRTESLSFHGAVAGTATLGMLSGAVGWPLGRAKRRLFGDDSTDEATSSRELKAAADDESGGSAAPTASDAVDGDTTSSADQSANQGLLASVSSAARARWIAGGTIACLFGFPIAFLLLATPTLLSDPPLAFKIASVLPILGAAGTLAAAGCTVAAWREGYWGRISRLHYTLVVASAAAFCWLLYYWNFLGVPF